MAGEAEWEDEEEEMDIMEKLEEILKTGLGK